MFRPLALTAPDIGLIASIELCSCGYENAQQLSGKIVAVFRLCAQYLSPKPQYDFGMRSIKAILNVAREARAQREVDDEEAIIAKAICDYILCELDDFDLDVFQSIFNDIFPDKLASSKSLSNSFTENLICAAREACAANNIDGTDYVMLKIQQLYQLQQIAAGIILIGDAYSGKTTLYRTLASALALCGERKELNGIKPECKGACSVM